MSDGKTPRELSGVVSLHTDTPRSVCSALFNGTSDSPRGRGGRSPVRSHSEGRAVKRVLQAPEALLGGWSDRECRWGCSGVGRQVWRGAHASGRAPRERLSWPLATRGNRAQELGSSDFGSRASCTWLPIGSALGPWGLGVWVKGQGGSFEAGRFGVPLLTEVFPCMRGGRRGA